MSIDIHCLDRRIILLDAKPLKHSPDELQLQYAGKKALQGLVYEFEKSSSKVNLSIWSDDDYKQLVKAFFNLHEMVEDAGGVVFNEHDEILFIHRNGKWDLPKGKISSKDRRKAIKNALGKPGKSEAGYLEEQIARITAIREVKEETGLKKLKISSELPVTYHIYFTGDRRFIKQTRWYRMEGSSEDLSLIHI